MSGSLKFALAAVAIVLLGFLTIVRPLETAMAERYADLDNVRERFDRDAMLARQLPALSAERTQLAATLARRHVHEPPAALVDRFLRVTARVADREHVAIQTLAAAPAAPPLHSAEAPLFEELHLDVTLRGTYDDVLRAARAINASDVATQLSVASLGNTERHPGQRPQLNATFHITLLREADAAPKHAPHAV